MKLIDQYKDMRKEVYIIFIGKIVTAMGSMVFPLLTLILRQKLGMSAANISTLLVIANLGLLPVNWLGGKIADRCNKKNAIVISDLVSISLYIICSFIPLSYLTIALIYTASVFQSLEHPVYEAFLTDITKTKERDKAFSLMYFGSNLGMVLSPTLAGILFKNYLWLCFLVSGLSLAVSTYLIAFKIKNTAPVVETANSYQQPKDNASTFQILKENPVLFLGGIILALTSSVYSQYQYLLPLDLTRVHGDDGAVLFGTLNSLNCVIVILFTPLFTQWFTGKIAETKRFLLCDLLIISGYVVFLLNFGRIPVYYLAITLFTFGEVMNAITASSYLSKRMPASHRGRIFSVNSILNNVFYSLLQLVIGHTYDSMGNTYAWLFTITMAIVNCILILVLIQKDRKTYPALY